MSSSSNAGPALSEDRPRARPDIYWVTGDQTDSGKTTLAAALIRVLNQNRISALGFKPFGGVSLRDSVDFMLTHYPKTDCAAFGADALRLMQASALTSNEDIDLIAPAYVFYYPDWRNCLFARTGSTKLGNVKYYRSEKAGKYLNRVDFKLLLEKAGVPISRSQIENKLDFMDILELAENEIGNAYRKLVEMGADAIVCEGASHYIPSWKGCPPANHVLFVSSGTATLIPNLNYVLSEEKNGQVTSIGELGNIFDNVPDVCSFQIGIAPTRNRERTMDGLAMNLLKASKLIA